MERKLHCTLREYMDDEQINIAQLARELGVTENAIRGYAKNTFSRIDTAIATKICDFFNLEFGELFQFRKISTT